jgi:hypothetical protein
MRRGFVRLGSLGLAALVAALLGPDASRAIDLLDGRVQIHGFVEEQIRLLDPNLDTQVDLAMWRTVLRIETEVDLAPKGFLFFDSASFFSRIEVSYDCVWTHACGLFPSANAYGDRTGLVPSYYMTGHRNGFVGDDPAVNPFNKNTSGPPTFSGLCYSPGCSDKLAGFRDIPGIEILANNVSFAETFAPFQNDGFMIHQLSVSQTTSNGDSSGIDTIFGLWRPKDNVQNNAALSSVPNQTTPLPMRPPIPTLGGVGANPGGLYAPSPALRQLYLEGTPINYFDQNFSQNALAWNVGASQSTWRQLQQAYVDLSTLEGRLTLRLGKQAIIWGKTELFRNTDQINPSDFAVATLPTLDESRISVWAARAIYSLYDVGPLQDVRAELVWILNRFMPNDLGRCGEPFSPLPVCSLQSQLFLHGALGAGISGETRPPNWWNSLEGNQLGGRVEFRWDRFSFAITDYYHYDPGFNPTIIQSYSRRVDPFTGRPLANSAPANASCLTGAESACLRPGTSGVGSALTDNPQNRQLFDVICSSSIGFFALDPTGCSLTLPNSQVKVSGLIPIGQLVSASLAGSVPAAAALRSQLPAAVRPNYVTVTLNHSLVPPPPIAPGDLFPGSSLNATLTPQQQALLGCGPFYQTNCDTQGADLFNGEASIVFQSWPGNNPGNQVATRYVNGVVVTLPGARGPNTPGYNPFQDGCVTKTASGPCAAATNITGKTSLVNPLTGNLFPNVLAALSFNALEFLTALDIITGPAPGCALPTPTNPLAPLNCTTIQNFFSVTGTTRPDLKAGGNGLFGRRDFVWAGAGEVLLQYQKVNTLGFAMDFAEDRTATNWGVEMSWTPNGLFSDSETSNGLSRSDKFDLTISIDRPTFVNFLNESRTFFFNMQWFLEYLSSYRGGYPRGFEVNGPFTALGTFTIQTGYFQDRLQPALTLVYDVATASGGIAFETAFRFTANLSLTLGVNGWYGQPQSWSTYLALGALGESNQRWTTEKFDRLNAIRERDEAFARLRYTF